MKMNGITIPMIRNKENRNVSARETWKVCTEAFRSQNRKRWIKTMKDYYELFVQLSLIYCEKEDYSCSKKVKAQNAAQKSC